MLRAAKSQSREGRPMNTWDDIVTAAFFDPILYQLVMLVERGYLTREEGLIAVVLGLVDIKARQHAQIVELLNTNIPRYVVIRTELP
jgi:hypothetical protein